MQMSPKFGNPWSEPSPRASDTRLGGFWSCTKVTTSGRTCLATRSLDGSGCEEAVSLRPRAALGSRPLEIHNSGSLKQLQLDPECPHPITQSPGMLSFAEGRVPGAPASACPVSHLSTAESQEDGFGQEENILSRVGPSFHFHKRLY